MGKFWTSPFAIFGAIIIILVAVIFFMRGCHKDPPVQILTPTVAQIDSVKQAEAKQQAFTDSINGIIARMQKVSDSAVSVVVSKDHQLQLKEAKIQALATEAMIYRKYKDDASQQSYLDLCDTLMPQVYDLTNAVDAYRDANRNLSSSFDSLLGATSLQKARLEYDYSSLKENFDRLATNAVGFENSNRKLSKVKKFGLGMQLGGTFINGKPAPVVALGLSYNFIRF